MCAAVVAASVAVFRLILSDDGYVENGLNVLQTRKLRWTPIFGRWSPYPGRGGAKQEKRRCSGSCGNVSGSGIHTYKGAGIPDESSGLPKRGFAGNGDNLVRGESSRNFTDVVALKRRGTARQADSFSAFQNFAEELSPFIL